MQQCVNDTIQKYLEDGCNEFQLRSVRSLYEIYKHIRITMAEKGMIIVRKIPYRVNNRQHSHEAILTNPKTIACGLLNIWCYNNGACVTQKEICDYFHIAQGTIRKAGRILEMYIEDNELELSLYDYDREMEKLN